MNEEQAMAFNNALAKAENEEVDDIILEIANLALRIEELPRHRNYSLAITKLDEARHWLRDREYRPA